VEVELDLEKSLEKNASDYFEKSKKAKRKLVGLRKAMIDMQKKVDKAGEKTPAPKLAKKAKSHWFQAFHWFKTSQGFLVIGGRDAKSNEAIVKKHLEPDDKFLHADIQGASAVIVKSGGKEISEPVLQEAAQFAAARSKAWQQRLPSVDVYAVSKEQVSKSAPAGEALATGGFMIYGKRQWFRKTRLQFAVGLLKEGDSFTVMAGPPQAIKKHCIASFEIILGKQKKSDIAKIILQKFGQKTGQQKPVSLDQIIAVLPGEGLEIRV